MLIYPFLLLFDKLIPILHETGVVPAVKRVGQNGNVVLSLERMRINLC